MEFLVCKNRARISDPMIPSMTSSRRTSPISILNPLSFRNPRNPIKHNPHYSPKPFLHYHLPDINQNNPFNHIISLSRFLPQTTLSITSFPYPHTTPSKPFNHIISPPLDEPQTTHIYITTPLVKYPLPYPSLLF